MEMVSLEQKGTKKMGELINNKDTFASLLLAFLKDTPQNVKSCKCGFLRNFISIAHKL